MITVEINKNKDADTFDLNIQMKGFDGHYFLALEHVIFFWIKDDVKGDILAQQGGFYQLPNTPLFDLRNALLKEVQSKINSNWRNLGKLP